MKKKSLSILAIMTILLTASCSRGVRMPRELAVIDSLMDIKPDSALALLGRMDSMPMRQSDRMYLELLRGKAMNKAYVKFTSDSAMLEVARYFDRHGDADQRMLAHYVLGCAYRDMGSAPRALEQYQQATAQADTTSSACDLSTLMRVHSQMGELYLRLRLEELEKKEDSIAKQLAWQIGDTLSALMLEEQECNYLYNAGKYRECIEKTSLVHDAYLQHGFKKNALIIMIFYVKSYLALGEYDKAKYYLDCMENDSLLVPASRSLLGGRGILHYYRGKYYLKVADVDSAEIAFRKALPDIDLNNNALLVYSSLADVYGIKHLLDSVLKYTALYTAEKERRYHEETGNTTLQMSALYNYSVEQKIASRQELRVRTIRTILFIAIASVILLLIIIYLYWQGKQKENENAINQMKLDVQTARQELSKNMAEAERLSHDLERNIASLHAAEKELKLLSVENEEEKQEHEKKDQQIHELECEIKRLTAIRDEQTQQLHRFKANIKSDSLESSEIVEFFCQAVKDGHTAIVCEKDWRNLRATVECHYPMFHDTVFRNKKLTKDEYRACLLTKTRRFSPTDIEAFVGWPYNFASKKRQQLLKKIFGIKGGAAEFDRRIWDIH